MSHISYTMKQDRVHWSRRAETSCSKGRAFEGYVTVIKPPLDPEQVKLVSGVLGANVLQSSFFDDTIVLTPREVADSLLNEDGLAMERLIGQAILDIADRNVLPTITQPRS